MRMLAAWVSAPVTEKAISLIFWGCYNNWPQSISVWASGVPSASSDSPAISTRQYNSGTEFTHGSWWPKLFQQGNCFAGLREGLRKGKERKIITKKGQFTLDLCSDTDHQNILFILALQELFVRSLEKISLVQRQPVKSREGGRNKPEKLSTFRSQTSLAAAGFHFPSGRWLYLHGA